MDEDSRALRLEEVWTSDDAPLIHHVSHVCLWVFEGRFVEDEITHPGFIEPFFQFIKNRCDVRIDYLTSSLRTEFPSNCNLPADLISHAFNTPVLVVENVGFTGEGKPVYHSIEHLLGPAAKVETLRRLA
jgi:DNA-binding GntR family transcriptional regulator